MRLNFDLVTGFSIVPLQWFSLIGMLLSLFSACCLLSCSSCAASSLGAEVEGVFTPFALQFFLIGIMLFGIGLMGEYVGRIQQEVRQRPRYLVAGGAGIDGRTRPPAAPAVRRCLRALGQG